MRISDWSSDVCSSDLVSVMPPCAGCADCAIAGVADSAMVSARTGAIIFLVIVTFLFKAVRCGSNWARDIPDDLLMARRIIALGAQQAVEQVAVLRSEEHTSELQSLMRISYAVLCLKKKKKKKQKRITHITIVNRPKMLIKQKHQNIYT